jgi:hypothetical protein
VRSNREGLLRDIMGKKQKKDGVADLFRRKLMALKWKCKRDVFVLCSIHDKCELYVIRKVEESKS